MACERSSKWGQQQTWEKQLEEESKGPLKRPASERTERSTTESPIATPGRGEAPALGRNTPYGRFWIGNWEPGLTSTNDFIKDAIKSDEQTNKRTYKHSLSLFLSLLSVYDSSWASESAVFIGPGQARATRCMRGSRKSAHLAFRKITISTPLFNAPGRALHRPSSSFLFFFLFFWYF